MVGKCWSEKDEQLLRQLYPRTEAKKIAVLLNRTAHSVVSKANYIGILATYRDYSFPRAIKQIDPSPELSYLIGAMKGDGTVFVSQRRGYIVYSISLSAKDYEFVEAVQNAMYVITGKKKKIYKTDNTQQDGKIRWLYKTYVNDKSLALLLKQSILFLKKYTDPYPSNYLRGFFDAEGCAMTQVMMKKTKNGISQYSLFVIRIYNTDKELIDFCCHLLKGLQIYPSPKIYVTKGYNLCDNPKDCYVLQIAQRDSVRRFMSVIGTSIPRKRLIIP